MNKIIKYRLPAVLAIMLVAVGCGKNFLDSSLDRDHTPETLETNRNTIWQFANAMYAPIEYGFQSLDNNLFAAATDEAQQTATYGSVYTFNKGIVSPTNNPLSLRYIQDYEGIRAANFFLDYVKDGKGKELLALNRDTIRDVVSYEREKRYLNNAIAEAHIVKAFNYMNLIKAYGGVPMVEDSYEEGETYPRAEYDDIVAYIVDLVDDNAGGLAINWNSDKGRNGRFTLGVALAVKSRTLLYAASPLNNPTNSVDKWYDAAVAAHDIIAHPDLNYSLHGDYGAYFRGDATLTSGETIYAVRKSEGNLPEQRNYPIAIPGGRSGVTPTHSLVKSYEYLSTATPDPDNPYYGRDPRLDASVVVNESNWNGKTVAQAPGEEFDMTQQNASRTGYYLKKFLADGLNLTQDQTAQHNWVVFRYAEILLNYAEAMNEVAGPDGTSYNGTTFTLSAREALRLVRDRASTDLPAITTTDPGDFRAAVKHERRIELAFEDHRYWDLLRWKDAETILNQPVTGVKITRPEGKYVYTEQTVAERKFHAAKNYRLPFMRQEVINSNGTLPQNPGYEE